MNFAENASIKSALEELKDAVARCQVGSAEFSDLFNVIEKDLLELEKKVGTKSSTVVVPPVTNGLSSSANFA